MTCSSRQLAIATAIAIVSATATSAQTRLVPSTKDFIAAAAQSDHFEILEARTALAQTHDPRVRAFAQEMISAHMRTSQDLQQAALKAGMGETPKGLGGDQQKLLIALQSQRGVTFNRVYIKQQAIAHQEALVLNQGYAAQGASADVQQAARSAVPIIQRHLQMAVRLRAELGDG